MKTVVVLLMLLVAGSGYACDMTCPYNKDHKSSEYCEKHLFEMIDSLVNRPLLVDTSVWEHISDTIQIRPKPQLPKMKIDTVKTDTVGYEHGRKVMLMSDRYYHFIEPITPILEYKIDTTYYLTPEMLKILNDR